jgi:hypothetical protein
VSIEDPATWSEDPALRDAQWTLMRRWGNGVWLTGGGIVLLGFGALTLLTVGTRLAVVVGAVIVALGALFLGLGVNEFRLIRRTERGLKARGIPWHVPRRFLPMVHRSVPVPVPSTGALDLAYNTLLSSDPGLHIIGVKRARREVRAYTPAPFLWFTSETEPAFYMPSWWPGGFWQTIRISAVDTTEGSEIRIRIHPYLQLLGEALADDIVTALRAAIARSESVAA